MTELIPQIAMRLASVNTVSVAGVSITLLAVNLGGEEAAEEDDPLEADYEPVYDHRPSIKTWREDDGSLVFSR